MRGRCGEKRQRKKEKRQRWDAEFREEAQKIAARARALMVC